MRLVVMEGFESLQPTKAELAVEPRAPETTDERCERLLQWYDQECARGARGALARIANRDGRARQTVAADLERARKNRKQNLAAKPFNGLGKRAG
jgi:hypothetical protein